MKAICAKAFVYFFYGFEVFCLELHSVNEYDVIHIFLLSSHV
jgi:hypothetical protein